MQFEWDEKKARSNKAKHDVDFKSVQYFDFDTALYRVDIAMDYGEERWEATGLIGVRLHTLVFTEREDRIRVISLRKATPDEMKEFYER
jgi:uncharacterized DUF497 family protein